MLGSLYKLSQQIMIKNFRGVRRGRGQGLEGIRQSFFERKTPEFAWKFV